MNYFVPHHILEQYGIGKVNSISKIGNGLIHETFSINSSSGQYIIQKLNAVLATKEIAEDFLSITKYLESKNILAPKCVLTKNGKVLAKLEGKSWRMQTQIEGEVYSGIDDYEMLYEAGFLLGGFHRVLNNCNINFRSNLILHQTKTIYQRLLDSECKYTCDTTDVKESLVFLKKEMPKYFLPNTLPVRVIHGDPKISNIIFNNKKAVALIDLDTCNKQNILVELGDAFRSWCGGTEDDDMNYFDVEKFKYAWHGYFDGSVGMLSIQEKSLIIRSIGTITLELASRFLTDYFEDSYFGWDNIRYKTRKDHNLARCLGQLAQFKSYKTNKMHLEEMIMSKT